MIFIIYHFGQLSNMENCPVWCIRSLGQLSKMIYGYSCTGWMVAGIAHPHQTRNAKDGWYTTPPSNARCERQVEMVAGVAHPHWSQDANDMEVVVGKAYIHQSRDVHDRCWLHREMCLRHHLRHPSMRRPPLTTLPLPQLAHSPVSVPISLLWALWLRNSAVRLARSWGEAEEECVSNHLLICAGGGATFTSLHEGRNAVAACLRAPRCRIDENHPKPRDRRWYVCCTKHVQHTVSNVYRLLYVRMCG